MIIRSGKLKSAIVRATPSVKRGTRGKTSASRAGRFGVLGVAGLALAGIASPVHGQIYIAAGAPIDGRSVACVDPDGSLTYRTSSGDDCSDKMPPDLNAMQLSIGPSGTDAVFNGEDGSATFNGGSTFNGGVQFNGQVGFSGLVQTKSLGSTSINNSGTISTGSLNAGSLFASGDGKVLGSFSSDSMYANSATFGSLRVPGAATFDSSVSVGGNLTTNTLTVANALAVASGATIDAGGNTINNVGGPLTGTDAANKNYVDTSVGAVRADVTALGVQVSNHETRITAVEDVNDQQDSHLAAIDTQNTVQDARMTAIESVNTLQSQQIGTLQNQVGTLQGDVVGLRRDIRRANGGIASAVALGGTMIVPDSKVSVSFNLATYRGEQGYSASLVGRVSKRVYVQAGFGGSTVRGSNTGRIGLTFGL